MVSRLRSVLDGLRQPPVRQLLLLRRPRMPGDLDRAGKFLPLAQVPGVDLRLNGATASYGSNISHGPSSHIAFKTMVIILK
jgi:hypothetical protein